jgi:hypothetical protein
MSASRFEGRPNMKKIAPGAVILLVGAAWIAGAAQPVLKNKRPRPVSIKLEKELTLGEGANAKEPLFQSVRSFRVDGRGNIYVLDSRAPKLIKFGSDGAIVFSIGRKGQGPGEFMASSHGNS